MDRLGNGGKTIFVLSRVALVTLIILCLGYLPFFELGKKITSVLLSLVIVRLLLVFLTGVHSVRLLGYKNHASTY